MKYRQLTEKLAWLINRLRCMSVPEVVYRCKQAYLNWAIKYGLLSTCAPRAIYSEKNQPAITFDYSSIDSTAYLQEADAILAGNVILFAAKTFHVGNSPEWNRDPLSSILGPDSFSLDIPITNQNLVGDIKHVWELNRHLHLTRLAQAYLLSHQQHYLDGLVEQINSWLDQCPPLTGPNWTSSLELGIRLINWSLIWQWLGGWNGVLFKGDQGEQLRTRWLDSIFSHCQCITRHFSRYSSANNHLIGELAGLYIAAQTWPYWPQCQTWSTQAKTELEREAVLQHSKDGVNREQAFAYQVFTLEFLITAGLCGQHHNDAFSENFWHTVYNALRFLRSIMDVADHVPMVGDADDGMVLRLEPGTAQNRSLMILDLADSLFANKPPSDTAKWLLGNASLPSFQHNQHAVTDWQFPEGGYFLFGSDFNRLHEIKGLVDCGPLGYLGIAAHGHADALAITLSIGGEPCLIDPGTFSYWHERKWRDYFRGTSAHNTVRIDNLDQSVSGGRFMWLQKAQSVIEKMPTSVGQFEFSGYHDGYLRLADPVRHIRTIRYDDITTSLMVHDMVSGKTSHYIEQFWHFNTNLNITLDGNHVHIRGHQFKIDMELLGFDLKLDLFYGNDDLPLGWLSTAYDTKQPIYTLRVSTTSRLVSIEARLKIIFINF